MRFKNRKAFTTLLISHSIVLVLTILVSMITYVDVEELLKDEVEQYYGALLERNQNSTDSMVKSLAGVLSEVSTNDKVNEVRGYTLPLSTEQYISVSQSGKDFYYSGFDYVMNDIYIVFPKIDMVVASNVCRDIDEFYNIYMKEKFPEKAQWQEVLNTRYGMEFLVAGDGESIFYMNSVSDLPKGEIDAVVMIDVKRNALLSDSFNEEGTHFLVCEKKDGEFRSLFGFDEQDVDINEVLKSDMYKQGGKQYLVLSEYSSQNSWKYVYLVDMTNLSERVSDIKNRIIIGMLITSVIGVILAFLMARRQYKPILKTVSLLSKNFGDASDKEVSGEYEYIESVIERVSKEYRKQGSPDIDVNVREFGLIKFIRGEVSSQELKNKIIKGFSKKYYMVAVFHLDDISQQFFEESHGSDNESLAWFIIDNVFSDLLSDKFEIYKCHADRLVFIIGTDSDEDEREIYKWLSEGQVIIEKEFNSMFSIMMSRTYKGYENVPKCYSEALECIAHRFTANNSIIRYDDIINTNLSMGYYYPADQELSLSNYLKMADYGKAKGLLDKMLDYNMKEKEISSMTFKCMIYDLCGTVVKTISEIGEDGEKFLSELSIFENIEECNTAEDIRNFLSAMLSECCRFTEGRLGYFDDSASGDNIVDKIKEYIAEKFTDSALSVAMVAEKFDMNPNYLSTMFKQKTGISLWEYITSVRMNKAQEIFKAEHLKIEAVAQKCGYDSVRTFSRAFTKYTGVSPGKFRDKI